MVIHAIVVAITVVVVIMMYCIPGPRPLGSP